MTTGSLVLGKLHDTGPATEADRDFTPEIELDRSVQYDLSTAELTDIQ